MLSQGRVGPVAGAVAGLALTVGLATLLLSAFVSPGTTWTVRAGLGVFIALAVARPDAALLATAALIGFGVILAHLAGAPDLRAAEGLVVASLFGCAVRALVRGGRLREALRYHTSAPVALFALTALAAAVVWERVHQFTAGYASVYLSALRGFLLRHYLFQTGEFLSLTTAAVVLEGLGLFVMAAALCRISDGLFERALRMIAVGGAGLAALSIERLGEILLRSPDALAAMRATSSGVRISPQIPDYIAAGSYFSLCWLAALGLALARGRTRLVWVAVSLPILAALYLTGSRSVIAAALAGVAVLLALVSRRRTAGVRGVLAVAVVAAVGMVASYAWFTGRDIAGELARQSLTVRGELLRAGLHVMGTRPVFGVGFDRFFVLAAGQASPELRALWTGRMNPHNDFLRFGAELGAVGLGLFVWIVAAAGARIAGAIRRRGEIPLVALCGGLVAFLITSFVSNPLMVRDVSYAFWIALGLAVGQAERDREPATARQHSWWLRHLPPWLLAGAIVASVPVRAAREVTTLDPRGISYGLYEGVAEIDGVLARWTGPRATLFVDGRARLIELPVSGTGHLAAPQDVEILVDGRLANRLRVGPEWQRLRLLTPPQPQRFHRIDLIVSPVWRPIDLIPDNEDRRVLGVRVGVPRVIDGGGAPR